LPVHGFRDSALLAFNNLVQAGRAVGAGVITHLDADVAATHFVGDCGGGSRTEE